MNLSVHLRPLSVLFYANITCAGGVVSRSLVTTTQMECENTMYPGRSGTKSSVLHQGYEPLKTKKIGFIGAGNMARALARGWISTDLVNPLNITATARNSSSPNLKLMKDIGVNVSLSNPDVIGQSDIIIVSVKPYQVLEVMQDIQDTLKNVQTTGNHLRPLIISVAASVSLEDLEGKAGIPLEKEGSAVQDHLPIIRCIPSIACEVQSGLTVYTRGSFCNKEDTEVFLSLFSALGHCEEVAENQISSYAAITGSGLAYMAIALESMADGGVLVGIPHPIAMKLAAHVMIGTANLILKKNLHPAEVRNASSSPGGITIYGVQALEKGNFRATLIECIKEIVDKTAELKKN